MKNFYGSMGKKKDNWGLLIGLIMFLILLLIRSIIESGHLILYVVGILSGIVIYFVFDWRESKSKSRPASLGKVFEKKYPIIIQYSPPKGINPAEAGLLYNCKVEPTDLTSLIYQWKFENLIDIKTFQGKNSKKEYIKLVKLEDIPLTRPLFETEIFNSIFSMGGIKVIEGAFQLRYALMLEDLEYHGIKKGWVFRSSLGGKRKYVYNFLVILLFLCIYLFFSAEIWFHLPQFLILLAILFLLCVFLGGFVNGGGKLKFTDSGAKIASHLIGYRNFIKSCDENKIRLFLKEDPLFVDRTLPYATAFGLETEFLKKVSPLKKDWNARYVNGEKVPNLSIIRLFFGGGDGLGN